MEGTHRATGVRYESGLEKRFIDQCYMLGVKVERCSRTVSYKDAEGKRHTYHPDFYLREFQWVVEIKGGWAVRSNHGHVAEKWHAAMVEFNNRYTLISDKELKGTFVAEMIQRLRSGKMS